MSLKLASLNVSSLHKIQEICFAQMTALSTFIAKYIIIYTKAIFTVYNAHPALFYLADHHTGLSLPLN